MEPRRTDTPEKWPFTILRTLRLVLNVFTYVCVQLKLPVFLACYLNPLTTDDAIWRHQILAACYQLAQSVLKIGSALAERVGQGEVGAPLWLTVHGGGCSCL